VEESFDANESVDQPDFVSTQMFEMPEISEAPDTPDTLDTPVHDARIDSRPSFESTQLVDSLFAEQDSVRPDFQNTQTFDFG
jgi:hypothetical protein